MEPRAARGALSSSRLASLAYELQGFSLRSYRSQNCACWFVDSFPNLY